MEEEPKRRRGRPPIPESERLQSLNVMFRKDTLAVIEAEAEARDITMGQLIREIVERSISAKRRRSKT